MKGNAVGIKGLRYSGRHAKAANDRILTQTDKAKHHSHQCLLLNGAGVSRRAVGAEAEAERPQVRASPELQLFLCSISSKAQCVSKAWSEGTGRDSWSGWVNLRAVHVTRGFECHIRALSMGASQSSLCLNGPYFVGG